MYKSLKYAPIVIVLILLSFLIIINSDFTKYKYKIEDSRGNVILCNDFMFSDTNTVDVFLSNGDTIEMVDVVDISNL